MKLKVLKMPGQNPSTIEKKMISEAPLPSPRSVICSPSHITNMAPQVRNSAIWALNQKPGIATAPGSDSVNNPKPQPWMMASTTVAYRVHWVSFFRPSSSCCIFVT